jgi:hypothetical protein
MSNFEKGFLSFVYNFATKSDLREDFRGNPDGTMALFHLSADEMNAFKNADESEIAKFIKEDFKSKVDIVTPY